VVIGERYTRKLSKDYKYIIAREILDIVREELKNKHVI
jgi:hypothetical protein